MTGFFVLQNTAIGFELRHDDRVVMVVDISLPLIVVFNLKRLETFSPIWKFYSRLLVSLMVVNSNVCTAMTKNCQDLYWSLHFNTGGDESIVFFCV